MTSKNSNKSKIIITAAITATDQDAIFNCTHGRDRQQQQHKHIFLSHTHRRIENVRKRELYCTYSIENNIFYTEKKSIIIYTVPWNQCVDGICNRRERNKKIRGNGNHRAAKRPSNLPFNSTRPSR